LPTLRLRLSGEMRQCEEICGGHSGSRSLGDKRVFLASRSIFDLRKRREVRERLRGLMGPVFSRIVTKFLMRSDNSRTGKVNCIARACASRLIRIYERNVERVKSTEERSSASGRTDNCFAAPLLRRGLHPRSGGDARASPRKKQPDVSVDESRFEDGSRARTHRTHARTHARMHTHVRTQTRVQLRKKGRCQGASGWASGPIVHARGWVGSLLKYKRELFPEGLARRG